LSEGNASFIIITSRRGGYISGRKKGKALPYFFLRSVERGKNSKEREKNRLFDGLTRKREKERAVHIPSGGLEAGKKGTSVPFIHTRGQRQVVKDEENALVPRSTSCQKGKGRENLTGEERGTI